MYLEFTKETISCTSACIVDDGRGSQRILALVEQEPDGRWLTTLRPAATFRRATDPHATSYLEMAEFERAIADLGEGYAFVDVVEAEPD